MGSFGLAHPHSPPQKLGSAKHSIVIIRPSDRNSHLAGKHAGKRTNVCEKPSFYTLRKQHANPPHPTPSQLQLSTPTRPLPKHPSPLPQARRLGPRRPAGSHLPVPAAPKSGFIAIKLLLPSPRYLCPPPRAAPACDLLSLPGAGVLRRPGDCPAPRPLPEPTCPPGPLPPRRGWRWVCEGGEGRRHRVRSGCRCRCRSESVLAAAAGDRGL